MKNEINNNVKEIIDFLINFDREKDSKYDFIKYLEKYTLEDILTSYEYIKQFEEDFKC